MGIEIRMHTPGGKVDAFVQAANRVFGDDPMWIPPLDFELKERLSPTKNPFFQRGEAMLFTAWQGGRPVGRISASVDREHQRVWKDDTGFFGFFDTVDDAAVGQALVQAAEAWLRSKGVRRMMGPFGLYANEEVGVLVEGFDSPPVIMMGHSRAWQGAIAEACGLVKEKDLFAWKWEREPFTPRVLKAWEQVRAHPGLQLRSIDPSRMDEELRTIMDIYNDAWDGKWMYVPALPDEVTHAAKNLRLIIDPRIAFIAELRGRAVGMCIMLPNLNEAIADMGGRLLPFNFAKLLYRTKVQHPRSCRLMMLGIRKELRTVKELMGLSAAMYVEVAQRGVNHGYEWAELSWTREDDAPINSGIRSMGARVYKKYRVYAKPL
jgi:GNAT superfamily N-acetyltransferase